MGVIGLLSASGPAASAEPAGFVYCTARAGAQVFAGRRTADGGLKFGISVWSHRGNNISVFGTARRHGRGWRYAESLEAATAVERCRLDIVRGGDGTLTVAADPNATCQSRGGYGAGIGTVRFSPDSYEGPVKTELDDPEAFQKAGTCGRSRN